MNFDDSIVLLVVPVGDRYTCGFDCRMLAQYSGIAEVQIALKFSQKVIYLIGKLRNPV